jgi:hypothetical protein
MARPLDLAASLTDHASSVTKLVPVVELWSTILRYGAVDKKKEDLCMK